MSCKTCQKIIHNDKIRERNKIRELAWKIAKMEGRTQILLDCDGNLSITCEECWIRGGRIGTPLEYFIL